MGIEASSVPVRNHDALAGVSATDHHSNANDHAATPAHHSNANDHATHSKTIKAKPSRVGSTATLAEAGIVNTRRTVTSAGSASADGQVYFTLQVPRDFDTLVRAVIQMTGIQSAVMRWQMDNDFTAIGETSVENTDSLTATDLSMTANVDIELDVAGSLTGIAANDVLGIQFTRRGTHANDTMTRLEISDFILEYTD